MRIIRFVALAVLIGGCANAGAHSPLPGIGHFYGGMLHPLLVPAHAMGIIVMGLWLGQRWPGNSSAMLALALAVPMGMFVGVVTGWQRGELVILGLTAIVAITIGADRRVGVPFLAAIEAAFGMTLGVDSLPDGLSGSGLWLSLGGTWLAVLVGVSGMIVLCEAAVAPWVKIGLRVAASWIAAAAILVLAVSWVGPRAKSPAIAPSSLTSALALVHTHPILAAGRSTGASTRERRGSAVIAAKHFAFTV